MRFWNQKSWWTLIGIIVGLAIILLVSFLLDDESLRIPLVTFFAILAGAFAGRFIYANISQRTWKRRVWIGFLAILCIILTFLMIAWKKASDAGGQQREEPFRIAGNLYYVGTNDVTSFLLTGSEGHVLIDGGYPGTADSIIKNIQLLGFKSGDVKMLLNTHGHLDHAGGLDRIQKLTGAKLWISEGDFDMVRNGGMLQSDPSIMKFFVFTGLARYPSPVIHNTFGNGDTLRLGNLILKPLITPGHTPGNTSWTFDVQEGDRVLHVVDVGSLTFFPSSLSDEKNNTLLRDQFKLSYQRLRSYPADIFLGSHAGFFDMHRKLIERPKVTDEVSPFIDPEGYHKYIDESEHEMDSIMKKANL